VSAALLAIRLSGGLSAGEYGLILRSPYFRFSAQEGALVDLAMRRKGIAQATLELSEMASLFPRLAPAFAEIPKTQRASGWSRSFSQLVRASGWPGTRDWSSAEYQAIESWKNLLSEFSRLDAVLGEMGFDDARRRLDRLAEETSFGPADEDEPVQVMGVLEAAGARFDALWITGLEDRVWPPSAKPNPFVPLGMQRAAGAPGSSAEQQAAYAARVTARLLAAAPEVICSYPERDGEEMLRPSPLIAGLPVIQDERPGALFEAIELEVVADDQAPPLAGNSVQRGGMNVVADQSACPFRAFARHRLHAKGLEVVEPGLTPRERGTVTHKVMELIWSELKTQKALLEIDPSDLRELVQNSVRSALLTSLGIESRKMAQMQALEEKRLTGVLHEWLNLEKLRPGFEVIGQERSGQFRPGGLELNIKTDRVDRYTSDGKLAIIDYKTGVTETLRDWDGERLKAPQVPLYCVAADQDVATAVFGRLAAGDIKFIGYSDREQSGAKTLSPEEFQEKVAGWRQTLDKLGAEFIGGEARVQPALRTTCRLCDLQPLCRISSASPEGDEASE
jgi:probable DNA repair protein